MSVNGNIDQEREDHGHPIQRAAAPWEMRDVVAKDTFMKLQEFRGTPEECVKYAEEDADDAFEIANTFLRIRKERKIKYLAQRRKEHVEDDES